MSFRAFAVLAAALLAPACSVPNQSHCGNQDGDATCLTRDPNRAYCSLCEASNDGCVAEPVTVEACHMMSDSGAAGTSTTTPGTTAPTSGSGTTTTGTTTTTTTTASTSTGTGTSTGTSTTGTSTTGTGTSTTTGTTEMSSGTDTSGTGGPVCGDGTVDADEACDGMNLDDKKCSDFAPPYGGGTLACDDSCQYDFDGCCKLAGQGCLTNKDCCSNTCLITCQ